MCSHNKFAEKYDVLKLVTEIKKHPCLYDFTLPDRMDRGKTVAAWEEISDLLGCSVRDCKEKWRKIRIAFGRFLKLSKSSTPPTRAYHLSDHLQFLVPFVKTNGPASLGDQMNTRDDIEVINLDRLKNGYVSDEEEIEFFDDNNSEEQDDATNDSYVQSKEDITPKRPQKREYIMAEDSKNTMSPRKMFLLSLLPDLESLTEQEMRIFRRSTVLSIDDIINARQRKMESAPKN